MCYRWRLIKLRLHVIVHARSMVTARSPVTVRLVEQRLLRLLVRDSQDLLLALDAKPYGEAASKVDILSLVEHLNYESRFEGFIRLDFAVLPRSDSFLPW